MGRPSDDEPVGIVSGIQLVAGEMRARVFDPNKNTTIKRFKKKALLIGVKQIRSTDTEETTMGETKKVNNSRALSGSHRDAQAMKRLLIGRFI